MLRFAVCAILAVAVSAQFGPPGPPGSGMGGMDRPPMSPSGRRMEAVLSACLADVSDDILEVFFDAPMGKPSSSRRRRAADDGHRIMNEIALAAGGMVDLYFHDVPDAQTRMSMMIGGVRTYFTSSSTVAASTGNERERRRFSTLANITYSVIKQLFQGTTPTGGVTTVASNATLTTVISNGNSIDAAATTVPAYYPTVDSSIILDIGGNFTLNSAVGQQYEGIVIILDSISDFACSARSVRLAECKATGGITSDEATATAAPMTTPASA